MIDTTGPGAKENEQQAAARLRKNRELAYMNQQNIIGDSAKSGQNSKQPNKIVTFFSK